VEVMPHCAGFAPPRASLTTRHARASEHSCKGANHLRRRELRHSGLSKPAQAARSRAAAGAPLARLAHSGASTAPFLREHSHEYWGAGHIWLES